ncbi:unnamed protein product [Sympodiomycopsis kandeliae]
MLVASPHSSSTRMWPSSDPSSSSSFGKMNSDFQSPSASISKRKRSSRGFTEDDFADESPCSSWMQSTSAYNNFTASHDEQTRDPHADFRGNGKRVRNASSAAPTTSPRLMPSSPSNVPFSSAFRKEAAVVSNRPPTIEEQQSWASSSSKPIASPSAGIFATASPQWVKVSTDYGHAFVRDSEDQHQFEQENARRDDQCMQEEKIMSEYMIPDVNSSVAHLQSASESQSLWRHIEGDNENIDMEVEMDMESFNPDTSRRGDSFSWESDILQLRLPCNIPHAHPYSPAAQELSRSQLGATYFDQCVSQAARS